jgi:hypothetical protein
MNLARVLSTKLHCSMHFSRHLSGISAMSEAFSGVYARAGDV